MDAGRSADYYDQLAGEYDHHASQPGDLWVRGAFHEFVRGRLGKGARLLDFGCGTGTDALWYAGQGYSVHAYDNSGGMIDRLRIKCREAIARQEIEAWSSPYETFLAERPAHSFDAVTANFAVINHLPSLTAWFSALAARLLADGAVFVSALNPLGASHLAKPRNVLRAVRHLLADGVPSFLAENDYLRYWPWVICRAAAGFRLTSSAGAGTFIRYHRGPRDWDHPRTLGERLERHVYQALPLSYLGPFVFLELRRCR